jgi:hypothetical protein
MAGVNVLKELLEWSTDRPLWQRDALRRLVTKGDLGDTDIVGLAELCKASHGLAEAGEGQALAAVHLPSPGATASPVSLTSLTHHSGVNALAADQTIDFGQSLTVVYGANAAGKSGYTRILKRACRARGAEEILGNVVAGSAPGRPSATVKYITDGKEHEADWDDDNPPNAHLSRVSVFDRHCASVYIAEQTDVAFRPLGLDLFDKLSDACEGVRRTLEKERRTLEAATLHFPDVPAGTAVAEMLSRLTSLTRTEKVEKLATLSEEETGRVDELRKRLRDLQSDDPHKAARALELRLKRVEGLVSRVRRITESLADEAIRDVFAARDRMREAQGAAEAMRRAALEQQPLPNTGSEAWRALWKAAERFSISDAYPDDAFPVTDANARCVLCQQPLRDDGIERMRRFQDFLTSETQRERDDATTAFEWLREKLANLVVKDDASTEALEEVQIENPGMAEAALGFLDAVEHRRVEVLNGLADQGYAVGSVPAMPTEPGGFDEFGTRLKSRITELRGTDRTEVLAQVEKELRELEARQVLGRHLNAVLGEIERKKRLAAFQLCLDETKTNAVTRKSSEVTKVAVTERLAQSFKEELDVLRFRHVEVEMVAAGGSRGSLYHKLQLRRAPGVSVPKVVSEGEARCLSIASFFAELSTAADSSAILFDDPVSSLDHGWRDNVARRLVEESKKRQVVVFTHDIVFLVALTEHAEKAGVEPSHQNLRRGYSAAGLTEQGPPYPGMKVSARIGCLKTLAQTAGKLHRENKPQEYEQAGTTIYRLLRQAWERAVEEILLNGTVERYRKSVETNRARCLGDISAEDCEGLEAGMTKCSKWEGGHDHAAAEGSPFPAPDEIETDIKALDDWVKGIRKRRN